MGIFHMFVLTFMGIIFIMCVCVCVCRAINYDEKDPFLCNSCGFSKYAKFELMVEAKTCSAVDPIENEDDRKKVTILLL